MDPRAKHLKAAKRRVRALDLIRQGLQLNQWAISKVEEDTELYIIGKPEMVQYLKEMLNETLRQETAVPRQTGSLELGASSQNDSQTSHAGASLQEEGTSETGAKSES